MTTLAFGQVMDNDLESWATEKKGELSVAGFEILSFQDGKSVLILKDTKHSFDDIGFLNPFQLFTQMSTYTSDFLHTLSSLRGYSSSSAVFPRWLVFANGASSSGSA